LIEKTETRKPPAEEEGENPSQVFLFAKVWTAENDALKKFDDQDSPCSEFVVTKPGFLLNFHYNKSGVIPCPGIVAIMPFR
jgi:hypothetical protein